MIFAFLPPFASRPLPQQAFRRLAFLSVVFCLSACSGLTPHADGKSAPGRDALRSFALDGRFALRHEDKSYSGRLSWRHAEAKEGSDRNEDSDNSDEILLASPLGQGLAEIVSNAGGARLTTSDGRSYAGENAEVLTQRVLGYPLPLGKLADWVRGRRHRGAAGGPVASLEADAIARPLRLREDGWRIDYEYDSDDPQALPGRLFIERTGEGGFDLRLRIDEWGPAPSQGKVWP
jgi:outer membrane lipoprotein LolB